jgi:GT2 family glycosyltransferase
VTANIAFRREVFDRIGAFDPSSPRGGESTDFCRRFFRETGWRLELEPRAVVLHRHRSTVRDFFTQQWSYGRGHAFLYIKYAEDLPWGWRQTAQVYADLARSATRLLATGARYVVGGSSKEDLWSHYLALLRKVALRLGFTREALSRGRLLL